MSQPNQRQSTRLTLEGTTVGVVDVESGIEFCADARTLSGEGLSFRSALEPSVGADMQVVLRGTHPEVKPLRALFKVLRVLPAVGGGFEVAGRLHPV